jgi:PAS domain S-box-containing protein
MAPSGRSRARVRRRGWFGRAVVIKEKVMSLVVAICEQEKDREFEAPELRRVLNLSTSALTYWDRAGVCRYANRAAEDWFGLDPQLLVGCRFGDLAHVVHLEAHAGYAEAALRGEVRSAIHAFRHPHGERIGLVRYLPDLQRGVAVGFVVQVSVTPAELRLHV